MKLLCAGVSHTGKVRRNNEDAILVRTSDRGALLLVADGIGGREYGEVVSTMLRDSYAKWWEERFLICDISFQVAIAELKDILLQVNCEVVNQFGRFNAGSTLVLLFLYQGNCLYISSGDSRIYLARKFSFQQITVDDVYENLREPKEKFEKASRGKLVGAVGIRETPEFSIRTDRLWRGDRFFLCSDGVYRYLSPQKLHRRILLGYTKPEKLLNEFSKEIEQNGAADNYSMIYVCIKSL